MTSGGGSMRVLLGIISIVVYGALTYYLGWNLKRWLISVQLFRYEPLFWSLIFFVSFSFIFARLHEVLQFLSVVGNYWMFVFEYGLLICVMFNVLMLLPPFKNMVVMGIIAIALLVILFIVGTFNAYSPVVRNATITVQKAGEPMRIVLASDFHLGVLSGKKHLQRFVQLSNDQNPDLVLLAGDLVDDDPKWFVNNGMNKIMAQLQTTYGVYGILGNHEYYGGKIDLLVEEMRSANVTMLLDETVDITEDIVLTGQEDITNKNRLALSELKPQNDDKFWIVMNHTPNDLLTPTQAGVDLHLSGHTHKGQMWPNNLLTERMYELDYGYKLKDTMHAFVSSGFGFWGPPTRIGSRSELWVIDVQFTQPN